MDLLLQAEKIRTVHVHPIAHKLLHNPSTGPEAHSQDSMSGLLSPSTNPAAALAHSLDCIVVSPPKYTSSLPTFYTKLS